MRGIARRVGLVCGLVCGLVVALGLGPGTTAVVAAPGPVPTPARAAPDCVTSEGEVATTHVLVVVVFPSGTYSRCVAPGGSGLDILRRTGLAVEIQSFGATGSGVCGITDLNDTFVGCPDGPDCFLCPASQSGSRYWGYYRCYAYSQAGAGRTTPAGGTVEAWRYGGGGGWSGDRPAKCDDGRTSTTTTTSPPTPSTGPPASNPPGGSTPSGPGPGPTGPSGTTPPSGDGGTTSTTAAAGPGATTTTGPDRTTTTDGATTTTGPDTDGTGGDDDAPGDEDVAAGGEWVPAARGAGGTSDGVNVSETDGGGAPVGALAGAGGIVAVVGALAIRARRSRAAALDEP